MEERLAKGGISSSRRAQQGLATVTMKVPRVVAMDERQHYLAVVRAGVDTQCNLSDTTTGRVGSRQCSAGCSVRCAGR